MLGDGLGDQDGFRPQLLAVGDVVGHPAEAAEGRVAVVDGQQGGVEGDGGAAAQRGHQVRGVAVHAGAQGPFGELAGGEGGGEGLLVAVADDVEDRREELRDLRARGHLVADDDGGLHPAGAEVDMAAVRDVLAVTGQELDRLLQRTVVEDRPEVGVGVGVRAVAQALEFADEPVEEGVAEVLVHTEQVRAQAVLAGVVDADLHGVAHGALHVGAGCDDERVDAGAEEQEELPRVELGPDLLGVVVRPGEHHHVGRQDVVADELALAGDGQLDGQPVVLGQQPVQARHLVLDLAGGPEDQVVGVERGDEQVQRVRVEDHVGGHEDGQPRDPGRPVRIHLGERAVERGDGRLDLVAGGAVGGYLTQQVVHVAGVVGQQVPHRAQRGEAPRVRGALGHGGRGGQDGSGGHARTSSRSADPRCTGTRRSVLRSLMCPSSGRRP